jgi:hypothetical protein
MRTRMRCNKISRKSQSLFYFTTVLPDSPTGICLAHSTREITGLLEPRDTIYHAVQVVLKRVGHGSSLRLQAIVPRTCAPPGNLHRTRHGLKWKLVSISVFSDDLVLYRRCLKLNCIQALKCNTNKCPTGIATQNKELQYGVDPKDKSYRVYNFHKRPCKLHLKMSVQ